MRETDLTDLRRKVEPLVRQVTDLWRFPRSDGEWATQLLDKLNLLDDFADALAEIAADVEKSLDERGVTRKRCGNPECEDWIQVAPIGRPREFCGEVCGRIARALRGAA